MIRAALAAVVLLALAAPASAAPRCLGAASRDPEVPCRNPRLRLRVKPKPQEAVLTPNFICEQKGRRCEYGARDPAASVALLGDSHAQHWRPALYEAAQGLRWFVVEWAEPHCPFSAAIPDAGPDVERWCPRFNAQIIDWLGEHPEVKTVLVSAHTRLPIKVPDGSDEFQARVDGFLEQWDRLPASVEHVLVLHDTPLDRLTTFDCVRRAMRFRVPAGAACTIRRSFALPPDAEETAAGLTGRSAEVIDLSRQFCGPRRCFPVVGGVLVNKDVDHIGQLFAHTLGPILERNIRNLPFGYGLES